jgi:hypothetical protein
MTLVEWLCLGFVGIHLLAFLLAWLQKEFNRHDEE